MIKKKTNFALKTSSPRVPKRLASFWASQLLVFLIGLVLLAIILIPLLKNYAKQRAIANEIKGIQQEIKDFESKNQDLSEALTYLQSNDSLEEQARLNLGLKKPGERVIVIQSSDSTSTAAASPSSNLSNNWSKWWHYFFDH